MQRGVNAGIGKLLGLWTVGCGRICRCRAATCRGSLGARGAGYSRHRTRGRRGASKNTILDLVAAHADDHHTEGGEDVDLSLVFLSQGHGHGYSPSFPVLAGGTASSPGCGVGASPLGTSAGLSQVETRRRRLTKPPCWPVSDRPRMTKKFWSRSRLFTKRMICG